MNQTGKRKARILVVDDDPGLLRLLTIRLRAESYDVEAVESAAQALAASSRFRPDLVITDLRMDQMDGIGLLKELQNRWPGLKVIILTAHGTIPDAVQATQMGAFGFLTKPVDKQELLDQVQKALRISGFGASDEDWRAEIVTRSAAMEEKLAQAHMVAGTDARVLITGESGTGKELLARAIHRGSPRRNKPFVAINCSAMAEELLESELFGHEKGSFTGATRAHRGLFMAADGGTLMLDEIGDMPMRLQVKLLRVLQENVIRPVGSTDAIATNVRVISATHRDLQQLMASGQFREDLYYRLNVVHIEMPSLNRRREDIPLLVAHFLAQIAKESGVRKIYAPEAVELLATADWPGNIRQLQNVVRQNVALSQTPIIPVELVQQSLGGTPGRLPSFDEARDEFTRSYLSQILQITGGNVSQAARLARRNRTDFYKLLARHQLTPEGVQAALGGAAARVPRSAARYRAALSAASGTFLPNWVASMLSCPAGRRVSAGSRRLRGARQVAARHGERLAHRLRLGALARHAQVQVLRIVPGVIQPQVRRGHHHPLGHDDRALDAVLQLPHVARPAVGLDGTDRIRGEPARGLAEALGDLLQQELREQQTVALAVLERRDAHRHFTDAIEEVIAEGAA
jgi:two-component system response regulator GlrR